MNKNKLGTFTIARALLLRWSEILPIMGNFVIVHAEPRWDLDEVQYIAYSELFEEIPEHTSAPQYQITVTPSKDPFAPAIITATRQK
jgi:hypothetical protein